MAARRRPSATTKTKTGSTAPASRRAPAPASRTRERRALALALLHATPRRRTRRTFAPSGQALHAVCRALAERLSRELHLAPASASAIPKHFGLAALVLGELLETRIAPTKGGAA